MAARQSLSREPSQSARSTQSRRSSLTSNPNIFSDEYALDSPIPSGDLSPVTPVEAVEASSSNPQPPSESTIIAPYPQIPMSHTARDSIAKRPLPIDDASSTAESGLDRSLSTSTRFSLPRAQSPYNGPTAPSHPYSMYQQVTRASSIASDSTVRPHAETPFVPRGGPEHPYALYTQNTVPEEEEDITAGGIPIGFPRSLNFQSSSGGSNSSDVGDIVGSDGHVEQLPPYTRYADNTVAKGNMDEIHGPQMVEVAHTASTEPLNTPSSTAVSSEPVQPRETFDVEGEKDKKNKWKSRAKKKTCGGMPVWGLVLIVVVIILAAVLGGVIGGVVGNSQGSERARANAPATETVYLDATPTTVAPNVSPIPTGAYTVPLNQTQDIGNCIQDQTYSAAWDCLQLAYINMTIQQPDPTQPNMQAVFQDFTVADFIYGPQPPDFNGTAFPLNTMVDKDDEEEQIYGAAAFFSVTFDKMIIVEEHAIPPPNGQKRSISDQQIKRRGSYGKKLQGGDKPWFCFWNSTVSEFWIYLEQPELPSPTTAPPSSVTSMATSPSASSNGQTWAAGQMQALHHPGIAPYPTTFIANFPSLHHNLHDAQPTPVVEKRGYGGQSQYTLGYPRVVKMVEKRMPGGNIQPYCQQMMVTYDVEAEYCDFDPIPNQGKVYIDEIEFNPGWIPPSASADSKRRRDEDVQEELQSRCICEWMTEH